MERKIYQYLVDWKNSSDRKPLVLEGARQVGKTYIANLFGANEYANVVYCNFEREEEIRDIFTDLNPKNIVNKLSALKRREIIPGDTLIVFDEVQACPEALTSLKYFCEEANGYHIIATGSLLGVSTQRRHFSFPVGKVILKDMHPMDFEEFLLASGDAYLVKEIKRCYEENIPLDRPFHERALELYKAYLLVGGMPEAVDEYCKNHNFDLVRIKQQTILDAYLNDMSKHNTAPEISKTRLLYESIGVQLARENKKFKYSSVKSGGRASEFAGACEWLSLSGAARRLYRLEQIKLPLNAYKSLSDFKFYMNDVGLCSASLDIIPSDILFNERQINDFKGGLTENYVYNQLIGNGLKPFYWASANQAEVDFVVRLGEDIIPIEVKSSDNTRSKSLGIYAKRFDPKYMIRLSSKNFGFENGIKSAPLYAAFCIK